MDTRDPKINAAKAADDLGRHQHVLDAYLAHAGDDALPPPALDAKLLALAAQAVNSQSKLPGHAEHNFARSGASEIKSGMSRARRRRWPFALAASVATIGFAAILARTAFQDTSGYTDPTRPSPSYESKSAAVEQSAAAPSPFEQQARNDSHEQAPMVAAVPVDADKAKLSQRAPQQERGGSLTAPDISIPEPIDSSPIYADAAPAQPIVAAAPSPHAQLNTNSSELAASKLGIPSADLQEMRNQHRDAQAPSASRAAENGIVDMPAAPMPMAKSSAGISALADENTPSSASGEVETKQAPQARMRSEFAQPQANAPIVDAPRSNDDEFAPDAQADSTNPHAKSFAAIRALRDSGEVAKATAMLARFQKAYPQVPLPADLAALAKAK